MNKLVSSKTINTSHVAPDKGEDEPIEEGVAVSVLEYKAEVRVL